MDVTPHKRSQEKLKCAEYFQGNQLQLLSQQQQQPAG